MNPPRLPLHIVKVGGSLLLWPGLPRAINSWLTAQRPAIRVLVCGGGPFADGIRQADDDFALGEEASHWLCVDCLAITARLLAKLVSASILITDFGELQRRIAAGNSSPLMIFDPFDFLQHHEARQVGSLLPHTWQVTSDSIAARLAEVLAAEELVLLKSAAPTADDLAKLAVAGYVDPYFPEAARNVRRVCCINLRGR